MDDADERYPEALASASVSNHRAQRWDISAHGRGHRVEIAGSVSRTTRWCVDGRLVAARKSADESVRLTPGDRLDKKSSLIDAAAEEQPDVGALVVKFSAVGRPKRVTWYQAQGDVSAIACALLGRGGIDLEPEPGSPAALREDRIRRQPRRYAAIAVAGGLVKVVGPLLLGLLAVRLTTSIPWPDWDLPSVPWPSVHLPSIPRPDVNLPDWQAPEGGLAR